MAGEIYGPADFFRARQAEQAALIARRQNPYAAARAPASFGPAIEAPPASADQGAPISQSQPNFAAAPTISMDPMQAAAPEAPLSLATPPRPNYTGDRSKVVGLNEDMRGTKFGQDLSRDKQLNVYQDPAAYEAHMATVMGSPVMRGLTEGADRMAQLRADYLKNAPFQADLSPVMALADYIAKGKGTAQAGYKRPMSYDDMTANISSLLSQENAARAAEARLAAEQAGPLKSGVESAATKTGLQQEAQQGTKEEPSHIPFMQPLTQGQTFLKGYEAVPGVKDANDAVTNMNRLQILLAKPNWYTDNIMKSEVLQGMHVNRVTQNELTTYGNGSQGLWNRGQVAMAKLEAGRSFSTSDIHDIKEFVDASTRAAIAIRDLKHKEYNDAMGPLTTLGPKTTEALLNTGEVHPTAPPAGNSEKAAQDFASQFMQMMQNSGKK